MYIYNGCGKWKQQMDARTSFPPHSSETNYETCLGLSSVFVALVTLSATGAYSTGPFATVCRPASIIVTDRYCKNPCTTMISADICAAVPVCVAIFSVANVVIVNTCNTTAVVEDTALQYRFQKQSLDKFD